MELDPLRDEGIDYAVRMLGLQIVEADADTKAKSARMAMLGSRINMLLSIPMLLAMTNAH